MAGQQNTPAPNRNRGGSFTDVALLGRCLQLSAMTIRHPYHDGSKNIITPVVETKASRVSQLPKECFDLRADSLNVPYESEMRVLPKATCESLSSRLGFTILTETKAPLLELGQAGLRVHVGAI